MKFNFNKEELPLNERVLQDVEFEIAVTEAKLPEDAQKKIMNLFC